MSVSWLLLKKSVKQSSGRLLLTASAIALGFLVVLIFTSAVNALTVRQDQSVWRGLQSTPVDGVSPLLVEYISKGNLYRWQNKEIETMSVRATDGTSPKLSGLTTPNAGEYYVTKALDKLIEENPDEQLGARLGVKQIGIIPDRLVGSPDELSAIRGMSETEAAKTEVAEIYSYNDNTPSMGFDQLVGFILLFGGTILLFPIVLFIVIATQLGSAQREKRYAAIRLVGATQGQVTRIMALETLLATLAGILIGTLLYFILRIPMAQFYYEGERFWPEDITLHFMQYINIALMTIFISLGATWWGMRRTRTSPLGVARDQKVTKKPRLWKLLPLTIGLSIFTIIATPVGQKWLSQSMSESPAPLFILIGGILLIMFGFIWAGSWITAVIAKYFATRTPNAQTLIATKRISGNSSQIFRSVSGVVLALFAGSFYLTTVSGIDALDAESINNNGYSLIKPDNAFVMASPLPLEFEKKLSSQDYIASKAAIYLVEEDYLVQCSDLASYTKLICPKDTKSTDYARVDFGAKSDQKVTIVSELPAGTIKDYLVKLDSNDNIDKLRTLVSKEITDENRPGYVISGTYAQVAIPDPLIKELAGLAYIGMAVTLFVAIASLIVSTIGGLLERQKSLMTLRLGGMTIGQMKQIVMIESLIPLIAVSLIAAGVGAWVGNVFVTTLSTRVEPTLSPVYFIIVLGALIVAAIAIYLVLPMLARLTNYEDSRTE